MHTYVNAIQSYIILLLFPIKNYRKYNSCLQTTLSLTMVSSTQRLVDLEFQSFQSQSLYLCILLPSLILSTYSDLDICLVLHPYMNPSIKVMNRLERYLPTIMFKVSFFPLISLKPIHTAHCSPMMCSISFTDSTSRRSQVSLYPGF